jgi:hypothetical protein
MRGAIPAPVVFIPPLSAIRTSNKGLGSVKSPLRKRVSFRNISLFPGLFVSAMALLLNPSPL